jgi:hypothetical protein
MWAAPVARTAGSDTGTGYRYGYLCVVKCSSRQYRACIFLSLSCIFVSLSCCSNRETASESTEIPAHQRAGRQNRKQYTRMWSTSTGTLKNVALYYSYFFLFRRPCLSLERTGTAVLQAPISQSAGHMYGLLTYRCQVVKTFSKLISRIEVHLGTGLKCSFTTICMQFVVVSLLSCAHLINVMRYKPYTLHCLCALKMWRRTLGFSLFSSVCLVVSAACFVRFFVILGMSRHILCNSNISGEKSK